MLRDHERLSVACPVGRGQGKLCGRGAEVGLGVGIR